MNARSASPSAAPFEENSDTDSNPDDELPQYYQPIAAASAEDGEDGVEMLSYTLPNGNPDMEPGISDIDINELSEEEEDVEGVTAAVVSDSEIVRAFMEDESRRMAPLPADRAVRVMEAMRGVAFAGTAPDWAGQVPEDQWIHQLRRIRESSTT